MSIAEIKSSLNITSDDNSYDNYLNRLYDLSLSFVRRYVNIPMMSNRNYTFMNVSGVSMFKCYDQPVNSIVSVTADGAQLDKPTVVDQYFFFDQTITATNLTIVANTGLTDLPQDLEQIVNLIVEYIFKVESKSVQINQMGNVSLSPKNTTLPAYIYEFLDTWVWTD